MPITKSAKNIILALFLVVVICELAWAYGSRDPILETQSKTVAVTEETLKDEPRSGAPAPTFKLVHDTGVFFVKTPVEFYQDESIKESVWHTESFKSDEKYDGNNDISHY